MPALDLTDPAGRRLVEAEMSSAGATAMDEELVTVIGTMPMSTLANFGGMSLGHDALDRVAEAWQQQAGRG